MRNRFTKRIEQILTDDIAEPQIRAPETIFEALYRKLVGPSVTYNEKLITAAGVKEKCAEGDNFKDVIVLAQDSIEREYFLVTGYKKNGRSKSFITNKSEIMIILTALKMKLYSESYVINKISYWGTSIVDINGDSEIQLKHDTKLDSSINPEYTLVPKIVV